ncbi:hypothetical protein CSPAE12_04868 [Colletotrichum incanum]|nr:hypothetical protein CSPAE12_04868 [Colletotrichum incanum]
MVAQVLPHLTNGLSREHMFDQGDQEIYTGHDRQTEHTPSNSSSESNSVNSAGLPAGLDAPKTPPNRRTKPQRASPTPAAYTFDDDDEFYPGTDQQLEKNTR